jgi:hypothetical protein
MSSLLAAPCPTFSLKVTILEPGGMRTDWAGSSMRVDPISAAYEATVGVFQNHIRENNDVARTDPAKAARVILEVAAMPNPPLRLLLGSDALFLAKLVGARLAADDAKWAEVSRSTDFDGLPDFAETPVAKMPFTMADLRVHVAPIRAFTIGRRTHLRAQRASPIPRSVPLDPETRRSRCLLWWRAPCTTTSLCAPAKTASRCTPPHAPGRWIPRDA